MDTVIIGAGGHGRVVLDILRAAQEHSPVGFLDANALLAGTEVGGVPVLGAVNMLPKLRAKGVRGAVVAIGDNHVRLRIAQLVDDACIELVNAIHPSAVVSDSATVGRNVVIAAGACVATDAKIGNGVIVNTGAIVEHECEIGDGAHVCPGAILAGRVCVGAGAFVGIGAKVIQCLNVGENATIGAGAVVLNDVPAGATVVGVPARVIRSSIRAAG